MLYDLPAIGVPTFSVKRSPTSDAAINDLRRKDGGRLTLPLSLQAGGGGRSTLAQSLALIAEAWRTKGGRKVEHVSPDTMTTPVQTK